MDTQTLIADLRALDPAAFEWRFLPYHTQKSKDGIELSFYACQMEQQTSWVETLVINLLEKTLTDRNVVPHSPFLPKEAIGALSVDDTQIHAQLFDIKKGMANAETFSPEDFVSGVLPKVTGYAFYGTRKGPEDTTEEVIFMRRTNPFLTGAARVRLCTSLGETVVESEKPFLKFMPAVDFLMLNSTAYFLSANMEKDFDFENRHFAVCAKHMETIAQRGAVGDYELLEKAAMSAKQAKKFLDFDTQLLDYIMQLSIMERMDYLATYGITVNEEGLMDTTEPEQCELIIDLLCRRSCLDAMGRLSVGSRITPRE